MTESTRLGSLRLRILFVSLVFALGLALGSDRLSAQGQGGGNGSAAGAKQGSDGRGGRQGGDAPGVPPTWDWWNDGEIRGQIGLTDDKAKVINDLYEQWRREAVVDGENFERQRDRLNRMTAERTASESTYRMVVQRVEDLRARLSESRTVLLYRIYLELTPEQYKKLEAAITQKFRSNDRNGRGRGSSQGPGSGRQ